MLDGQDRHPMGFGAVMIILIVACTIMMLWVDYKMGNTTNPFGPPTAPFGDLFRK